MFRTACGPIAPVHLMAHNILRSAERLELYCSSGRCGQHKFFSSQLVMPARGDSYESNMTGCLVCCGAPNLDARMRKFKSRGKFFFTVIQK